MKKWQLVCSKDEINVDYEEIIESETEPDFVWCNEIAQDHGCKHHYVYEIDE